jgi:glycosyltransferase involved in cell wall biosynthesis
MRVAVIGSICSVDYILAEYLLRRGVDAIVLRSSGDRGLDDFEPVLYPHLSPERIRYFSSPWQLLRAARSCAFVFSFTSQYGFGLGRLLNAYPLLQRLGWPRFMNIATGSDLAELAGERTAAGRVQRRTMRLAFVNMVTNFPHGIKNAARLRLQNACVLPFIFTSTGQELPAQASPVRRSGDELVILHPSRLDWKATDDRADRVSGKANDRFIRALATFLSESTRPVRLLMVDTGPDKDLARTMIDDLGIGSRVEWLAPMPRAELLQAMRDADVVVDQFEVGGFGGTAWEAMSMGTPVLMYLQPNSTLLGWDVAPPVLNAFTEEDIVARLHQACDREWLAQRRADVQRWAGERPGEHLVNRYLFYMLLACGRAPIEFGWERPGTAVPDLELQA